MLLNKKLVIPPRLATYALQSTQEVKSTLLLQTIAALLKGMFQEIWCIVAAALSIIRIFLFSTKREIKYAYRAKGNEKMPTFGFCFYEHVFSYYTVLFGVWPIFSPRNPPPSSRHAAYFFCIFPSKIYRV